MLKNRVLNLLDIKRYLANPSVSVLIPAFKAREFIHETLDSVKAQLFKDFELLISVDKSDDNTNLIVKNWCNDHRLVHARVFTQKHRLGWVKNTNFLLKKCRTKFFMVLPHDDLLHESYLQKMYQCLIDNEFACTAYSDIRTFGKAEHVIEQNSITGNKFARVEDFLLHHYNAVAFRGLVNRSILSDMLLMNDGGKDNFAMDTVWNLQMAIQGNMIRVPEILYLKRISVNTARTSWPKLGSDKVAGAWLKHCNDCRDVLGRGGFDQQEYKKVMEVLKSRLLQKAGPIWRYSQISNLTEYEKESILKRFKAKH